MRASVVAPSSVTVSAPPPPIRVSALRTARLLPVAARVRMSLPVPRSAVAPARAPVTVTASARVPPSSSEKLATDSVFATWAARVTTDRGLLRLGAGANCAGPRQNAACL
jgi:hypothetical protein